MVNDILNVFFNTVALIVAIFSIVFYLLMPTQVIVSMAMMAIAIVFLALAGFLRR